MKILFMVLFALVFLFCNGSSQQLNNVQHSVAALEDGQFHGWPANNGVWVWGNEILVGFTQVEYDETGGHNIKEDAPQLSLLARSTDGGHTWSMVDPDGFVGDPGKKTALKEPMDFENEGFALRIEGTAYHGSDDSQGAFFYSYDKGKSWNGPFELGNISELERYKGRILTPRTDYIVLNNRECLVFISSRVPGSGMSDKISVIRAQDGGMSFELLSPWVVPCCDPYRAVMPNTVQVAENEFVMSIRRRVIGDGDICWLDAYASTDGGKTWEFRSKIADAGEHNGNPPAMTKLDDGRLCCIYGNRTKKQILGRYSRDNGKSWDPEFVIRDQFYTGEEGDMKDLGYPRLVQNADGDLVALYYWASDENKQQHIAASVWTP